MNTNRLGKFGLNRVLGWVLAVWILVLLPLPTAWAVTPKLAAGSSHSLMLKADGTVWAWGWNASGQLGDGTTTDRLKAQRVPGIAGIRDVAAGGNYSLALKNDGTVWAWGSNASGQLGDGTTTDQVSPVAVTGLTGVIAVAAGATHSLALKSDGTVWAWGSNASGQLGDGTTTDRYGPVTVSGLRGVVAVVAGGYHSLALESNGTVRAWGNNGVGQLGDGTTTDRYGPVTVSGLRGVVAVVAGVGHSLALKSDGTVWAWGLNNLGQLGDGTTTQRLSPVAVPGLTGVVAVAGGGYHSLALKSDGTVLVWGYNAYGELGDGTITNRTSPVVVPSLSGVAAVATGGWHTLAVKAGGAVLAWGYNGEGELGDGTTTDRLSPVRADDDFPVSGLMPAGWTSTTGSSSTWTVSSDSIRAGPYALKSGAVGDNAYSGITYTGHFRDGFVRFHRRVSSEPNADYLRFYVDGEKKGEWSGAVPWDTAGVYLTAGVHTLDWKYEKNASGVAGSDAAWIDSVSLPTAFNDTPATGWAFDYINALKDAGITTGCGSGNYCPAQNVNRQQMAAFIIRAVEGDTAPACTVAPFADVATSNGFCKYIKRMSDLTITTGCGGGNYCPTQNVNRQQMAAFIIRAVEGEPAANYCGGVAPFNDVTAGSGFCGYIKRMAELNITTGCGGGNYCPASNVTREQMAAFLARAFLGM